jgi:hypothetical protein
MHSQGLSEKNATDRRPAGNEATADAAKVREVNVGSGTLQMTQETVPTGLVPLPRFLRRFAGLG